MNRLKVRDLENFDYETILLQSTSRLHLARKSFITNPKEEQNKLVFWWN